MLAKTFKGLSQFHPTAVRSMATSQGGKPKKIVVTGAAGQIAYSVLFRLAR